MDETVSASSVVIDELTLAQDTLLILMLRQTLVPADSLVRIARELRAFSKGAAFSTPIAASAMREPRDNAIDLKSVCQFSIGNEEIAQASMQAESARQFANDLDDDSRGVILAMHRQNHILSSCMTMAQLCSGRREAVFIFDPPHKNSASTTLWLLFDGLAPHVRVLSTAPRDIIRAIRLAQSGAAVAIAADVITDRGSAVSVPWGAGVRSAMLGPAHIASASGATLAAVTPITTADGADILIDRVEAALDADHLSDPSLYRRTLALWSVLEEHSGSSRAPGRPFPARPIAAKISCIDDLQQCMANIALSHPPMMRACPSLLAFITSTQAT